MSKLFERIINLHLITALDSSGRLDKRNVHVTIPTLISLICRNRCPTLKNIAWSPPWICERRTILCSPMAYCEHSSRGIYVVGCLTCYGVSPWNENLRCPSEDICFVKSCWRMEYHSAPSYPWRCFLLRCIPSSVWFREKKEHFCMNILGTKNVHLHEKLQAAVKAVDK